MPKLFSLLILHFSFFSLGISLSRPLLAEPADLPLCYMQTRDGATLNLSPLCGIKPVTSPSKPQSCSDSPPATVAIVNINYSRQVLTGQLTNQTCKTVTGLRVNYEVLDRSGEPIDNGFIAAQPSTLLPGQSATFSGPVIPGAKVRATHATWSQ